MSDSDLAFAAATDLLRRMRRRQLSPVELVECYLQRIERLNPRLNAFLYVDAATAREEARAAEARYRAGGDLPPLLGLPVPVKDLVYTKGMPTTGGSLAYRDFIPTEDAVVVERLRRAGAILLGKTNTPEFGLAFETTNRLGEDCRNPWNLTRTSGGSSGGAGAAVAAGLAPLAVGTDGGGSIRIPAAWCGVFGFKPTFGTIPAYGGFGGMPKFSHVGPLSRTVRDAALFLNVTAGYDRRDPRARRTPAGRVDFTAGLRRPLQGLRLAWSADLGYAAVDPEILEITTAAALTFEELGCPLESAAPEAGQPFSIFGPIVSADGYFAQGSLLEGEAHLLTDYARQSLERGKAITGAAYAGALRALEIYRARFADFFEQYDLLLTPAMPVAAYPCGQRPEAIAGTPIPANGVIAFTPPFNLTGYPAAALPCGFTQDGLPVALQIAGRPGEDALVLRACAAFEAARPWADRRPPVD